MFAGKRGATPAPADERALDFLAKHGFDFVRIPTSYWFWTEGTDYFNPSEQVFAILDQYLDATRSRGMQLSLNLHRAPGYCINGNNLETHNLWLDQVAQDAFVFLWETFAKRYKDVPNEAISFDLLNEPPSVGEYGFTRDVHERIMRRAIAAIRAIDPDREIAIDGISGGHLAMPELADAGVIHSGRGYQPMPVSHFEANWWSGSAGLPSPVYPGTEWEGLTWTKATLREFYRPWREVEAKGVKVHIGEFGCFNRTPNEVAMRWFNDLFGLYREFGWGFSLWNFEGPFGIIKHGRPGTVFEEIDGYSVDRELLELLLASRITS
jgi:aryl-phospho-beta-D-glucosidase BglC (GH1 family)